MEDESATASTVDYIKGQSSEIADHVSGYGYLIADSLYLIALGMLVVFLLHKLASRFLYPLVNNNRLLRVVFGALYFMVFVITVLLALNRMGFETSQLGSILLLVVILGAILIYFLIPFFPRLPFVPGHMVETGGVMGTVDAISSFHTTIRKFDGTLVFLPNALVLASKILNYSYTPTRRIEMSVIVRPDCDLDAARNRLLEIVAADERVVDDPSAPTVFAMNADAAGVQMTIFCWVANADFLSARSDLWLKLVQASREDSALNLALPRQEILVKEDSPAT